jgi:predicted negative regulator of RcsB-dependent stress response
VDHAAKRKLNQPDQFVALTGEGVQWAGTHRRTVITWSIAVIVVILALTGGISLYQHRSTAAATEFGAAMLTYQTPLVSAAQAVPPGMKTFPDAKARATAANAQFLAVAHQYGMTNPGKLAQYFVGLTYAEEGQNGPAEDTLKQVSSSWNSGLAALGKMALAQLYQQTNRDSQAIELYNELTKTDSATVPAGTAQLQLADLYQSEGKTEMARKIYADLKDKGKDAKGKPSAASEIASEKLNPKAASAPGGAPQLQ